MRRAAGAAIEVLEERRLLSSTLIPVSGAKDLISDTLRNELCITTSTGQVQFYDLGSRKLLSPVNAGVSLLGGDVTADGQYLYVADGGANAIDKVNLNSQAVTHIPYSIGIAGEGYAWDLKILSDGKAYFTGQYNGSGWTPFRQISLSDDSISTVSAYRMINQNAPLARSADRNTLFLQEPNGSDGPIAIFDSLTATFPSKRDTSEFVGGAEAVSRDGLLVAMKLSNTLTILNRQLGNIKTLGNVTGGFGFDPVRDTFYGVDATADQVVAYDTSTWQERYRLSIGENVSAASAKFGSGVMTVSADGKELFLGTAQGVRMIDLPQATAQASTGQVLGFPGFIKTGVAGAFTLSFADPAGEPATLFQGTVHFTSTDPQAVLPADYTFTAADGGSRVFDATLKTAGIQTITATVVGGTIVAKQGGIIAHAPGASLVPLSGQEDSIYDPVHNELLITTSSGTVERYDLSTETLLSSWHVGTSLLGGDVTPDGKYLYVADGGANTIRKVDLDSGAVTNVTYVPSVYEGYAWDLKIVSNGKAFFTGQYNGTGYAPLREIDLGDDSVTERTGYGFVDQDAPLARSADRNTMLMQKATYGWDQSALYDAVSDSFPVMQATNSQGGAEAVSRDGSLVAMIQGNAVVIFNRELENVETLSNVTGGFAFDSVHNVFYGVDASADQIIAYDTDTWQRLFYVGIGEDVQSASSKFGLGVMTVSANGANLFLATPHGIRAFDLTHLDLLHPSVVNIQESGNALQPIQLSEADFAGAFGDPRVGQSLQKIRITSLPLQGTLKLGDSAVRLNQEIAASQLGTLTYTSISSGTDSFGWTGSDGMLYATNSAVVSLRVKKVAPVSLLLYSSTPDVQYGQPVQVNVIVTTPDASDVLPTGTVTLKEDGGTVIKTVAMVNGQASCKFEGLPRGSHWITATYSGDSTYKTLTSVTPLSVHVRADTVVDILALYTPSAAQAAASESEDIKLMIYSAVADTNDALSNSQINLSLELVDVAQTSYTESGSYSTDLDRLQNPHDGYMDEASSLRDRYGADLVCLFVGNMQSDRTIGLANVMKSISAPDNADWGFSEVDVSYAGSVDDYTGSPSYTLAHELGHNFGAVHDRDHAHGPGVYDDSYGYRYRGSDGRYYHDIMSYDSSSSEVPDVTIPYYSNPNISYGGEPAGKAGYSNVARTINATAPVVANYRPTVVPLVTATQTTVLPMSTGAIYSNLPVTLRAKVVGLTANPHTPAGTVTFFDGDAVLGTGTLSNGKAKWTGALTAGTPHAIRALYQSDDHFGDSISAAMPVAVTRLNIAEHAALGTVVGSAASMAAAGHTLAYAITAGNTDDVFAIDSSSGVISVAHPGRLDYELAGSYKLQVTASDMASPGMTGTARVIVNVIDVNEAPTDVTLTNYTVMQRLPAGALVGKLIGTDPDALSTLTYTLVGGAGSRDDAKFTILNGKLRTSSVLDDATKSVYKVRVRVTDQGGLWYEKPMVIRALPPDS